MIPDFFTIVQEDFKIVQEAYNEKTKTDPQSPKVTTAVTRLIGAGLMALGIGIAFVALPILSSGSLLGVAFGVALFAAGHDVFRIALNCNEFWMNSRVNRRVSTLLRIYQNLEKDTLLKPIWKLTADTWKPELLNLLSIAPPETPVKKR